MKKKIFIAGPCVIESAELLDEVAAKLVEINGKRQRAADAERCKREIRAAPADRHP